MAKYCESGRRWKTREVMVGGVGVGGDNPIRIQSMTTSNTRDVEATIDQIMRLADSGCEIARVTVQGMKEAEACEGIKNGLLQRGYSIPLVADIHFYPPAAMRVVDFVDKVRINPGNFVDKRASFKTIEYDDASYALELEKIAEKFSPLVEKCKRLGRSMRIGTNHGSLSDRIMNRYGDTPAGMVESALEFTRVARALDYHEIIYSMKASNPLVMIQAYRLLVARMIELGWNYPLHLGVTEAGDGEDGRVKSAIGIGSLLLDGLGDTIRVSLTEDPWYEIDPCQRLVQLTSDVQGEERDLVEASHRPVCSKRLPLHRDGSVLLPISANNLSDEAIGKKLERADLVWLREPLPSGQAIVQIQQEGVGILASQAMSGATELISLSEAKGWLATRERTSRFALQLASSRPPLAIRLKGDEGPQEWELLKELSPDLILIAPDHSRVKAVRTFCHWMEERGMATPLLFHFSYSCSQEDLVIRAAAECGALLCDGLGDGLCLEAPYAPEFLRKLSFNILQGARRRATRTEFIACPSCGRTLFDLQEVTRQIRQRTDHLAGVKIAIMGCIVNGPGEMADADFGYVGSTPGKIDLYVGKERIERNIDESEACERLIELIKRHNRWVERETAPSCVG